MLGWIAFALGMLLTSVAGAVAFLAGVMRVGRKGYPPLGLAGLITVAIGAGIGGFAGLLAFTSVDGAALAVLAPIVILVIPFASLSLVPRRPPRRLFAVTRVSFPYATVGKVLFIVGCVGTVALAFIGYQSDAPIKLLLIALVAGLSVSMYMKELFTEVLVEPERAVHSFTDILDADRRPPVVYMRAFEREGQSFVRDLYSKYGQFARQHFVVKGGVVSIALDEYLQAPLAERIGPFLALGNPQDYYTPTGATRAYFKDETWMSEFSELAQRAGCLLLDAGESSNLRWELQFLKTAGVQHKLVVVAGHPTNPYRSFWLRIAARLAGIPPVPWDRFAEMLGSLGYELPPGEPGYGSVIAFDSAARGHLLTASADLPDSYVTSIASWLENGVSETAACILCTRCQRPVLTTSTGEPVLCRSCIDGPAITTALLEIGEWTLALLVVPVLILVVAIPSFLGYHAAWITYLWFAIVVCVIGTLWYVLMVVLQPKD